MVHADDSSPLLWDSFAPSFDFVVTTDASAYSTIGDVAVEDEVTVDFIFR